MSIDYKKFYENIVIYMDAFCTDEIRKHASCPEKCDLDFQIFRLLGGYREALYKIKELKEKLKEIDNGY